MVVVVQAHTDDLVGVRDDGFEHHAIHRMIKSHVRETGRKIRVPRIQEVTQRRLGEATAEIDDAAVGKNAIAGGAVRGKRTKLHD